MVLAAVDDLMFASRIAATARQLGVNVVFVKSAEEMTRAAGAAPSMIILDLNAHRGDALSTLSAIKADSTLAAVRTIGFVSHVQGELVASAREAGIDEVLARSAFVERLPDILSRDRQQ